MSRIKVVYSVAVLAAGLAFQAGFAQAVSSGAGVQLASAAGTSSSFHATNASAAVIAPPPARAKKTHDSDDSGRILPFSRLAIGTKLGTFGWGGQIATPLTRRLNLRGGADFFNFGYGLTDDGTNYYASMHLKSGTAQVDVFPFRRSSFFISPGVLIFRSNVAATMNIPGGSTFTENNTDYTSDPTNPVNGSGAVTFGRSVMPALTIGFGNMITRRENKHWSAPFEIGAAYTGHYTLGVNLTGSACQPGQGCGSVNDPSIQANVVQETNKINETLKRFQFYPILTSGVAYRF
jgi:hypothetical protein